jgi:hypothetical protein
MNYRDTFFRGPYPEVHTNDATQQYHLKRAMNYTMNNLRLTRKKPAQHRLIKNVAIFEHDKL